MIFLVQDGIEIARLTYNPASGWVASTLDWGQCTSDLDSHMLHLGNYFPRATFVFVS